MPADRLRPEDLEPREGEATRNGSPSGEPRREGEEALADREREPAEEPAEESAPEAEEPAAAEPRGELEEEPAEPPKKKKERRWLLSRGDKSKGKGKDKDEGEPEEPPAAAEKAALEPERRPDEPVEVPDDEAGEEGSKRSRLRWKKKDVPAGLFIKCESCGATIYRKELVGKGMVCPDCGFHFTLGGSERIEMLLDEGTWDERFAEIETLDRLEFKDKVTYAEKIARTVERLGQKEALLLGKGAIEGRPIVLCVLDFKFMGGSMGEVVGEKIALGVELALAERLPLVIFTSSGGARMHEGMLSLMQMAKTCAALQTMREKGGFSVCIMTNPTTGGVTASFASVCDIVLAEPGALIGFAGPRVIATTLKQELPKGFQRAEFLLEKGQIDAIVQRSELRDVLARLIDFGEGAWR